MQNRRKERERISTPTEGLIRREYNDTQRAQILGGNALRVLCTLWPA